MDVMVNRKFSSNNHSACRQFVYQLGSHSSC